MLSLLLRRAGRDHRLIRLQAGCDVDRTRLVPVMLKAKPDHHDQCRNQADWLLISSLPGDRSIPTKRNRSDLVSASSGSRCNIEITHLVSLLNIRKELGSFLYVIGVLVRMVLEL